MAADDAILMGDEEVTPASSEAGARSRLLFHADRSGRDVEVLRAVTLDMAVGSSENDFELVSDTEHELMPADDWVYVEGSEFIGVIDGYFIDTSENAVRYRGRTVQGILAKQRLCPSAGSDYLTVSGDLKTVIGSLISRNGLSGVFTVDAATAGTLPPYRIERYTDFYSGLRAMLATVGQRPHFFWSGGKAAIGGRAIADWSRKEFDSLAIGLVLEKKRPVNHLICLGKGELRNRTVVHFYADAAGKVSKKQSLFGIAEIAEVYDYSNAEADELEERGVEKLREMQDFSTFEVVVNDPAAEFAIGDIVAGRESRTGLVVTTAITKKIARMGRNGVVAVEYEAGTDERGSALSGSSESSGGSGAAYLPGRGISIDGRTIAAEVAAADLAPVKADAASAASDAAKAVSTVNSAVAAVSATSPLQASRTDNKVALKHVASGVAAGQYGAASDSEPGWGDVFNVGPQLAVGGEGHITQAAGRRSRIPDSTATRTAKGLMSAADKAKLDGVAEGANRYVLPPAAAGALGGVIPDGRTTTVSPEGVITASVTSGASFLAAHPPGSYWRTTSETDPAAEYGGTWERAPSMGAHNWHRIS